MVTVRSKFAAVPLVLMTIMALLIASSSARPLGGDAWAGGASVHAVSGESILQLLRQLYRQQLGSGPGPSCDTNSSNGGCPPPSTG